MTSASNSILVLAASKSEGTPDAPGGTAHLTG